MCKDLKDCIIHSTAEYYDIPEECLLYGNRERKYSEPRHVVAYCLYRFAGMSYPAIARLFNKKSHRTIIYAVAKIDAWVNTPAMNKTAVECINNVLDYINNAYLQSDN